MTAIQTELDPLMRDDDWEVFAVDEVRMDQEAIIRKAWLQKGERTIVKVNRNKESQSYIGFLNAHPDKKIALIWDNAPFHKSKAIRASLAKGELLE